MRGKAVGPYGSTAMAWMPDTGDTPDGIVSKDFKATKTTTNL